jgi:hypothetical protein
MIEQLERMSASKQHHYVRLASNKKYKYHLRQVRYRLKW